MNRKPQGPRAKRSSVRDAENAEGEGKSKYSNRERTINQPYLPDEEVAYKAMADEQIRRYDPQTASEHHVVFTIIDTTWRLHRIPLLEARLAAEPDSLKLTRSLQLLARHEKRLLKMLNDAKKMFQKMVAQRGNRQRSDEFIVDTLSTGFVMKKGSREIEDLLKLAPVTNAWLV